MKLLRKVSKMTGYIEMENDLIRTPADVSREDLIKSCEEMSNRNVALMNRISDQVEQIKELSIKINNIKGVILDHISMNGELDNEDLKYIAQLIDMKLTKTVDVEYTVTFTGTAEIPIDVDVDDIDWENEVSFDATIIGDHELDLSEDSVDVDARDMY
jgi:hypothetical protein